MKLAVRAGLLVLVMQSVVACNKDDMWDPFISDTGQEPTGTAISGYVFRPALASASEENIAQLKLPAGFSVKKFADQLGKPRILAIDATGHVFVSDREVGTVMMVHDADDDGVAEVKNVVATIPEAHGLFVYGSTLYIAAVKEVYWAQINSDGTLGTPQMIINDLPDGGQHPNRTLAVGPDQKLYITVGSTCNACPESNPGNATLMRAELDGSARTIFARGLRNTIGFGWQPATGDLWGMDQGIDWLGDDQQEEEVNQIAEGKDFGWPYIYGDGKFNPSEEPPNDSTYTQYLSKTTLPELGYTAHSAAMQMAFYTGTQFGTEYVNDAFIAMRGSWNRSKPSGYKVVRLHFENGRPVRFDDFLTGFLVNDNKAQFARLVGVAVQTDGSLLVSDDTNGVIYRISKT